MPGGAEYKILFCGDVVGRPGRQIIAEGLSSLQETHQPLFTIINGENAAAGIGITPDIAAELFKVGADAITLGNHAFHKREIFPYLSLPKPIVRPSNLPPSTPGKGHTFIEKEGIRLAVVNLSGRVFMDPYDDPFRHIDALFETIDTPHIFIDFHGEATSEKIAMGWHCNGRATAVVGTHTHVTTADETILPSGTAYITDVGMSGPIESVLGMDRNIVLKRFMTGLPIRFEVANEPGVISAVVISVECETGRATHIERIRFGDHG